MIKSNPGAFPAGLHGELAGVEPEALEEGNASSPRPRRWGSGRMKVAWDDSEAAQAKRQKAAERQFHQETTEGVRNLDEGDRDREREKMHREFVAKGPSKASLAQGDQALQQKYAIQLQQQLGSGQLSNRGEAQAQKRLQALQVKLGENFPNLMNQTLENQARLGQIVEQLQRPHASARASRTRAARPIPDEHGRPLLTRQTGLQAPGPVPMPPAPDRSTGPVRRGQVVGLVRQIESDGMGAAVDRNARGSET